VAGAIARNLANDYHRRSVPEDPLGDDTLENDREPGKATGDERSAAAVLDAIRALPGAYRETLTFGCRGHDRPEIAARTG